MQSIPRTPKEAGLIQLKLKRKLKYKNYHKQEYIDPLKIFTVLEYLRKSGHPYYQFYDDYNVFKKRCREESLQLSNCHSRPQRVTVTFTDDREIMPMIDIDKRKLKTIDNCKEEVQDKGAADDDSVMSEEEQYILNDPIRKFQFDHNIETCLTNKYPEMLLDINGDDIAGNDDLSFAPGEGKVPSNILMEKDWDIKGWPSLHPDGKFGLHHKRKIKLADRNNVVTKVTEYKSYKT